MSSISECNKPVYQHFLHPILQLQENKTHQVIFLYGEITDRILIFKKNWLETKLPNKYLRWHSYWNLELKGFTLPVQNAY